MICRVFLACVFMVNAACWENLKFCPWRNLIWISMHSTTTVIRWILATGSRVSVKRANSRSPAFVLENSPPPESQNTYPLEQSVRQLPSWREDSTSGWKIQDVTSRPMPETFCRIECLE